MKFSIIVPVYNVDKYLNKCVDSLLQQTYEDYEIILVDDGSTDESPQICDEYRKRYLEKIIVVHKSNGGLSDARNSGIKIAQGEYLIFIDSDDFLCDNHFLEKINEILHRDKSDLLVYGNKKFFEKNGKYQEKKLLQNQEINIKSLINENYFKACAWDKVIKRNILIENKIFFPIGRLSEDIEWCARVLKCIQLEKISILNENLYVYRQRENSITKKVNEKHLNDIYEMIKQEIMEDKTDKAYIINSFLAYEYGVCLGWASRIKISKSLKNNVFELKFLLKYDISNKVKKINKLVKLIRN